MQYLLRNIKLFVLIFGITIVFTACTNSSVIIKNNELHITKGIIFSYQCERGVQVSTKYYSLSDDSLSFIKLTLPNEPEITLAQAISASGSRYSNESLEWYVKGNKGFVQVRNNKQKWVFMYKNCQIIEL